jgi:putative FmdB family regulatory protein
MPTYVFHCKDCKRQFEKVMSVSARSKLKLECPHCGGKRVHQLMTSFYAKTTRKA